MSHEWSERKEKGRMDRRVFCSKRCVSTREKRWVIRDLEDCYWWQAIHSSSKELQKRRAEIGEWKSEDGKTSVARREMICRHVLWYCTSGIVL